MNDDTNSNINTNDSNINDNDINAFESFGGGTFTQGEGKRTGLLPGGGGGSVGGSGGGGWELVACQELAVESKFVFKASGAARTEDELISLCRGGCCCCCRCLSFVVARCCRCGCCLLLFFVVWCVSLCMRVFCAFLCMRVFGSFFLLGSLRAGGVSRTCLEGRVCFSSRQGSTVEL